MLDFANTKEEIFEAFQPYYERTDVDEITDPNLVHDLKTTLDGYRIYTESKVKALEYLPLPGFEPVWPKGS